MVAVDIPSAKSPAPGRYTRQRLIGLILVFLGVVLALASVPGISLARSADRVTDRVRPELTTAGLARHRADFELASSLVTQLSQEVLPEVGSALTVNRQGLADVITNQYPAVDKLLTNRQNITTLAQNSLSNLEQRRAQFERADALPVSGVPKVVGPILGLLLGAALAGCGVLVAKRGGHRRQRWPLWVAFGVGAALVVGGLAAQVPEKLSDAQAVLRSLDPSQGTVDRTVAARDQVHQGAAELEQRLLPDLAHALGISIAQLDDSLARSYPNLAEARAQLPAVLARYDARVDIRLSAAPDLRRLRPLPMGALAWIILGFAVIVAGVAAVGLIAERSTVKGSGQSSLPRDSDG